MSIIQKNPGWITSVLGNVTKVAGKEIACGYPRGKCQPYPETNESVAQVAADNVFGNGQPQRDFMSYAQDEIIQSTRPTMKMIAQQLKLKKPVGVKQLMTEVGEKAASAIRSAIVNGTWEPNSDRPMNEFMRQELSRTWGKKIPVGMSYRAAKKKFLGDDKPLVASSHMLRSTTYVVRER